MNDIEVDIILEDGKSYVTEGGEVVKLFLIAPIEATETTPSHSFIGSNGYSYTSNGKVYSKSETLKSIVKEYAKEEPKGHIHAELMLEYGKDALISRKPWLLWQKNYNKVGWEDLTEHPGWSIACSYRRKPRTMLINGYEVPEPLRVAPEEGTQVYVASIYAKEGEEVGYKWGNNKPVLAVYLARGLLHLTAEASRLHAKAMLSFTTTEKL